MEIRTIPPIQWALRHPRLAAWIVLSAGMVILLLIEARDVGLTAGNWIALIAATIFVAGACIWIVSWEDVDDDSADPAINGDDAPAPDPQTAPLPSDDPAQPEAARIDREATE